MFWTDHQTHGRGRQQREWNDEPGSDLAVTFRVRVRLPRPLALPAATPIVVAEACEAIAGRSIRIKWPNDVHLAGKKLAGVLIDAAVGNPLTYLIGIGINCNRTRFPPDLEPIATSLALATGQVVQRENLLLDLATRLDAMLTDLERGQSEHLEETFRQRLGLMGREVEVTTTQVHRGKLVALDFTELHLEGSPAIPLPLVRAIKQTVSSR